MDKAFLTTDTPAFMKPFSRLVPISLLLRLPGVF